MNQYGSLALRHWQTNHAAELSRIADPERYFTELGEQIAVEIDRRAAVLEADGTSGDFLANLGMLNEARQTAESEVLREMLYTDPEPTTETTTR